MKENVLPDHVILLKRTYCKAKSPPPPPSPPLTRTIISFSSPPDGPASLYFTVFYQITAKISNDSKILCHGNATKRVSREKPYIKTNYQILSKAIEFINIGMPPKQVHDQIYQIKNQVGFWVSITRPGAKRHATRILSENKGEICWKWRRSASTSQMCSFQPNIRNLNAIGTNQDMTIYRGFAAQIPDLKLILCAYH